MAWVAPPWQVQNFLCPTNTADVTLGECNAVDHGPIYSPSATTVVYQIMSLTDAGTDESAWMTNAQLRAAGVVMVGSPIDGEWFDITDTTAWPDANEFCVNCASGPATAVPVGDTSGTWVGAQFYADTARTILIGDTHSQFILGTAPTSTAPRGPTSSPQVVTVNPGEWDQRSLGNSAYHVYLSTRDGQTQVAQIPYTTLDWNRVVDSYSTASVEMATDVYDLAGLSEVIKSTVDCWRYELTIYRNDARCWSGPITDWKLSNSGGLRIDAADISVWLHRRIIHNDLDFKDTDLASIATAIVDDAMAVDNVPGLVMEATPTGVKGDRNYKAKQYLAAGDQLDELSRTGLDWTVVDRQMIVGNFEIPASPIAMLTTYFFADDPDIEMAGSAMGTRWLVLAGTGGDDGPQFLGEATGGDPDVYGVHERVVSESGITDQASANTAAATRRDVLGINPLLFGGATLAVTAPITVEMLVPGRVVNVLYDVPGRELRGLFRIKSVKGTSSATAESVTIECEPVGTIDVSAEAKL